MKYNNAIFNYCLLLFIYVFIYFILFCYQTHLLRVTFKFTTTVCDLFVFFSLKSKYHLIFHADKYWHSEENWNYVFFIVLLILSKKLYSLLFCLSRPLISQCHLGKQEVVRQKPFQIIFFFLLGFYCNAALQSCLFITVSNGFFIVAFSCSERSRFQSRQRSRDGNFFSWTIWNVDVCHQCWKAWSYLRTTDLNEWVLQLRGRAWGTRLRTEISWQG